MRDPGSSPAREAYLLDLVGSDGAVTYDPIDPTDAEPQISIRVQAPGGSLGHAASFRYAEVYRRFRRGLVLTEYAYGFWSQLGHGPLEYHWHPLRWSRGRSVLHAHCAPPGQQRGHFRAHAMTLEEARSVFLALHAGEGSVDCSGLYPFEEA